MSGLPKGWAVAQIEDISVKCTQRRPSNDEKIQYIDIGSIDRSKKEITSPQQLLGKNAPSRARKIVNEGDVLVSLTRPNLNAVALVGKKYNEQFASTGFEVIKPVDVDSRYVFALVKSQNFINSISKKVQGALYPAAKSIDVKTYGFPLAPLNEQIRIANKLDSLLGKLETTQKHLDKIPTLLKRFRQSVLAAAVSGELTAEWRKQNTSKKWTLKKLTDLVDKIEAGKSIKCIEKPPEKDEYGIIKISAVTWGVYNENESKTLFDKDIFLENRRIKVGDFLISRANTLELLGTPVIVENVTKNLMLSDKVLRLVMDDSEKKWVNIFLRSSEGRKEIENRATGNQHSMRNIGQKSLLDIDLPYPSDLEKSEIIHQVESLFNLADKVEQQYQAAKQRTDKLTQSILAKAFRGELVPQDPNDEPASELLKRIQLNKA